MRKKNKNYKFIMIGFFYLIILFVISVSYSFFDTNLSYQNRKEKSKKTSLYQINYFIKEKKKSNNSYYYHLIPTLTYLGKMKTTDWKLYIKVPFDTEVIQCYYASSCNLEGEVLTISNSPKNGTLSPKNNSITMGVQIKVNQPNEPFEVIGASFDKDYLSNLEDNPYQSIIESEDIIPTLKFTGSWNDLSTYTLKIENHSSHITLSSWKVQLSYPIGSNINRVWGGTYQYDSTSGNLLIYSPEWEHSLSPSDSLEVNIHITIPSSKEYSVAGIFTGRTITEDTIKKEILIGGHS